MPIWGTGGCDRVTLSALTTMKTGIRLIDRDFAADDEISSALVQFSEAELKNGEATIVMPNQASTLVIQFTLLPP
jgi:hypothetical protein